MFRDGAGSSEKRLEDLSPDEVVGRLRRIALPPEMVPLSNDRQPFLDLPDETIKEDACSKMLAGGIDPDRYRA